MSIKRWSGVIHLSTFYTSNYLNWHHDDSLIVSRSRLDIAQEVISTIIDTNPSVDFGLLEFNYWEGGRIAQRIIQNMSDIERDNLIDLVGDIEHAGSTPMCESVYEAYRYYIAGEASCRMVIRLSSGTDDSGDPDDGPPC